MGDIPEHFYSARWLSIPKYGIAGNGIVDFPVLIVQMNMGGLKWLFCVKRLNQGAGVVLSGARAVLVMGNFITEPANDLFPRNAEFAEHGQVDVNDAVIGANH